MRKGSKDGIEPVKSIVKGILEQWQRDRTGKAEAVRKAWRNAAGEKTAKHTRISSFRSGQLTIEVDSSGLMYQLTLRKQDIMKKLKAGLKDFEIENLRFRIGDFSEGE